MASSRSPSTARSASAPEPTPWADLNTDPADRIGAVTAMNAHRLVTTDRRISTGTATCHA